LSTGQGNGASVSRMIAYRVIGGVIFVIPLFRKGQKLSYSQGI
jgi:hypothetical protein